MSDSAPASKRYHPRWLDGEGGLYHNPNARCMDCGGPLSPMPGGRPPDWPALHHCLACLREDCEHAKSCPASELVDVDECFRELLADSKQREAMTLEELREERRQRLLGFKFLPPGFNVEDYV